MLSEASPSEITLSEYNPSEVTLSERAPSEVIFTEHRPSEHTPSEDLYRSIDHPKSRDHDIDEELLLRSLALQNVCPDEEVGDSQGLLNDKEYPLVPCDPPPMKTVEEFVEEPEVMFQRLVDMEVMLRPLGNDEDNLKSALLKHVVSTVSQCIPNMEVYTL